MAEITIINHEEENQDPKNFSKGYLTLPFEGDQFKDFISGLLGKPQSITKSIVGNFEIHMDDLQSLFNLVNQRITQQNMGRLIQFTAKIHFNDKSSVQLGSYEELLTYNEVKPIISNAVELSWDYLIQFSDKTHPEKQSIEVTFSAHSRAYRSTYFSELGEINISIYHTARSWGSDIEAMLTNQVVSLLKPENKIKRFIRVNGSGIGLISGLLFFLITLIGAYQASTNFIATEINKVKSFTNLKAHSADEKLDFLTSYVASGTSSQHYFKVGIFILIMLVVSVIVGIWISANAEENREPSFILLTRKSLENKNLILKMNEKQWAYFFGSLLISIITGIASNYIFNWLVQ